MRQHSGFSLTEVLIALLIINIGILGALAGYTQVLKWTFDATQRTLAVAAAADLSSALHHIPLSAVTGRHLEPKPDIDVPRCHPSAICSAPAFLAYWQTLWQQDWYHHPVLLQPRFCLSTESPFHIVLHSSWRQLSADTDMTTAEPVDCQPTAGRSGFRISVSVIEPAYYE